MVFRKIIGFGDSSYVISLPKNWINTHKLSKGDSVNLEEDGAEIKIRPTNIKQTQPRTEHTINFDGNLKVLKSQLFNSYINDYSIINIHKKGINQFYPDIRKIVSDFIALEIEQTSEDRVVVKDYLNIEDISVHDTVRRMDRIVLSMFDDVHNLFIGKETNNEYIKVKDEDVNRLHNLVLKLLKKAINPNDRKLLNLDISEIFYYWDLIVNIEEAADQLKRVVRYIHTETPKEIIELYGQVYEHYKKAIKANFAKDESMALEIMNMRKEIAEKCENIAIKNGQENMFILEKIKSIHNCSGNIARAYIKLGTKN